MKRCSSCILPETTPNITFDDQGKCNYCQTYRKFPLKGEDALLKILNKHRRNHSKYDFIVGLSGGRDSTFTLLKMVKDYKMAVLAVNYENPFTDPQAKENIKNAVEILGVELVRFNLKNRVHERTFRNSLLTWMKKPDPGLIPMMCIGCKLFFYNVLRIAKRYNIHCIVYGGDPYEDTTFKRVLLGASQDSGIHENFLKTLPGILRSTLKNYGYFHPVCIPVMIKGYLFGDQYALGSQILGRKISRLDLFHYIEWNEQEILRRLRSELKWESPKQFASTWRFDCKVGHVKDLLYIKTLGLTERDDSFSKMVREGILTRDEALTRLKKENRIYFDEVSQFLVEMGIDSTKFFQELGIDRSTVAIGE